MLTVTETAQQKLAQVLKERNLPGYALHLHIMGRLVHSFAYDFLLVQEDMVDPSDTVVDAGGGVKVFIDAESAPNLEDAVLDFDTQQNGFRIDNPNPVWSSELGETVARLILENINPNVASHGGAILPVDVRDNVVYIRMLGGCQGCGMANATLKMGVERTLREALPQIREVVDVTHHAAGTHPYYDSTRD